MTTQSILLDVTGDYPVDPEIHLQPTVQRATPTATVGWKYRRRYTLANTGIDQVLSHPFAIDIGLTNALVSGAKALASGNDLRVWVQGEEVARTLVNWNDATFATLVWIVLPALGAGEAITYDIVYGNSAAGAPPTLTAGIDLPVFDIQTAGANRSTNAKWIYQVNRVAANAAKGGWYLSSGTAQPEVKLSPPGSWQLASTLVSNDNRRQEAYSTFVDSGTKYQARFEARRARQGSLLLTEHNGADGVSIRVPVGIVSVRADIRWQNMTVGITDLTPIGQVVIVTRNSDAEPWKALYANTALQEAEATIATATYTPVAPVKEVAFAVWPYNGLAVDPASRNDHYINAAWYTTLELNLSSTVIIQTTLQAETAVYELATEIRAQGGGDTAPVPPYKSIYLGNARSQSGVGTPRLAVELNQQVAIFTGTRNAEVWDAALTAVQESVPVPAIEGIDGEMDPVALVTVERISSEWMPLEPSSDPLSNSNADSTTPVSRFYYDSVAVPSVSPAFAAEWEQTAGAVRRALNSVKGTSAITQRLQSETSTTPDFDALLAQHVSGPLPAQTITGTVKGQAIQRENSGSGNMRAQCLIRVVSNDGTVERGTLYAGDLATLTGDPSSEYVVTFANRKLPRSGPVALTPVAALTGDRLVVEVGYRAHNVTATAISGLALLGEGTAADLPEDETTTDQTLTPWIEFSTPIQVFAAGGGSTGWTRGVVTSGVTASTAIIDATQSDSPAASFSTTVSANTAASGAVVEDIANDYLPVAERENVQLGVAIRTANVSIQPTPSIWFYDANLTLIGSRLMQADWTIPAINTWYRRLFAALVPVGAVYFRVGVTAKTKAGSGTTGQYWWDTVAVNDTELMVRDVNQGTIALSIEWIARHAYA